MRYRHYLCALALLLPITVSGQTTNTLTLEQAIQRTLQNSPALEATRYQAQAAQQGILTAEMSPAYSASLELENIGRTDDISGKETLESTLSLSKIFEMGDKSERRGQLARHEATMYENAHNAARLDAITSTARQFITVLKLQHMTALEQDALLIAEKTLDMAKTRVRAGRAASAEKRRAEIAYTRFKLNIERFATEKNIAMASLSLLWGDSLANFNNVDGNLFELTQPENLEHYTAHLSNNPDIINLITVTSLADARIQLAKAQKSPDIELSLGARHFKETDDQGLVFSASIPLGTNRRAEASLKKAALHNNSKRLDLEKQRLDIEATLYAVHQRLGHTYRAAITLRENVIPQAEKILDEYVTGYRAGRYSFLELTDAQSNLLKARSDAVTAAANYQRYRIEIDRLTGVGITTGTQQ